MNLTHIETDNLAAVSLQNDQLRMKVQMGNHFITADEPVENGGEATGPDTYELLSASLATCTMATLQLYIKRKNWSIKLLSVEVSFSEEDKAGTKSARFHKQVTITGSLDETQIKRLLSISDACPVSKILKSGDNTIETVIVS